MPDMPEKLVLVEWLDAAHNENELSLAEALNEKICLVKTAGYLLKESETQVTIAGTMHDDGTLRDVLAIPKGSVLKVTVLEVD